MSGWLNSSVPCRPGWIDVFVEVDQSVAVRIAIGAIVAAVRGRIETICHFPTIRHSITISVPAVGILIDAAIAIIVVGGTVGISVTVAIPIVDHPIVIIIEVVEADISHRILIGPVRTQALNELHSAFFIPIADWNSTIPPYAVIQFIRRRGRIPIRGNRVLVFVEVGE